MGKGLFFALIKHLPMEGKKWKFLSHGALLGFLVVEGTVLARGLGPYELHRHEVLFLVPLQPQHWGGGVCVQCGDRRITRACLFG